MKKAKKILVMVAALALTAAIAVGGTLAYLTSQDAVTNTFTVGNVQIVLDEADVTIEGKYETDVNSRVDANAYKLMPGHNYIKDPKITVKASTFEKTSDYYMDPSSENCYLFVKVENGISAIETKETAKTIASQMTAKGWKAVDDVANVYYYFGDNADQAKEVVSAGTGVTVFESFTVDGSVDNTTLATYKDAKIIVTAYAVQADGFAEKTPAEIWDAAFDA